MDKIWHKSDSYNYQKNQNNWALLGNSKTIRVLWQAQTAGPKCQTHPPQTRTHTHNSDKTSQLLPGGKKKKHIHGYHLKSSIHHFTIYNNLDLSSSCCCAYLTERRSCLLSLILTRMNPTWCHHSTRFIRARRHRKGTSGRVQRISNSHLNSCLCS